jgi:tetratricopeptide (TPR) repeat protein
MKTRFYLTVVLLVLSVTSGHAQEIADVAGKVFAVDGSATLERAGNSTPLVAGTVLQGGDQVLTGEPGRVAIELEDGSYIRLASGSRMKLPKRERAIGLFNGALHFLSHTTRHPEIETQQVTAAIRGTEFSLVADSQQTTINMFSGEVNGQSPSGSAVVTGGQGVRFRAGRPPETYALLASQRTVQWSMFMPFLVEGDQSPTAQRAISLFQKGQVTQALALLEAESRLKPCGPSALLRARMMLSAGDAERGASLLTRCASESRDPHTKAQASVALATLRHVQGNAQAADELSEVAFNNDPTSQQVRLARSFALQEKGDLKGALALVSDSREAEDQARKAELLFMSGDVPEARQILEGLSDRSWYAESVYGFVLLADRDIDQAQEAFSRAKVAEPGAGLPRMGLGLVFVNRGDLQSARREFEQATVLEPTRGLYRSYLAKAYFEDDQYAGAHPEYQRAIELDPNDPTPYLYRSFMRVAENDLVGALDDITKARELSEFRAVYRSRFLLDQDSAMQSASVGRVYQQLGFKERGRIEAIGALTRMRLRTACCRRLRRISSARTLSLQSSA